MQDRHIPVNRRERISQRGWRLKDWRLIKLGEVTEWQSIRDTSDWRGAF